MILDIVSNMAKGRISKRVFQGNKARQIFRKTNISYPLIPTRTCAYQGVRNVRFSEIWCALFSWNTRFEIRPFAILLTIYKTDLKNSFRKTYLKQVFQLSLSFPFLLHSSISVFHIYFSSNFPLCLLFWCRKFKFQFTSDFTLSRVMRKIESFLFLPYIARIILH